MTWSESWNCQDEIRKRIERVGEEKGRRLYVLKVQEKTLFSTVQPSRRTKAGETWANANLAWS
jgi:hypothetical protein